MGERLEIRLLGSLRIRRGGHPVHLRSARLEELLSYLLLAPPSPQPREHLSFLFWPNSTEPQARTNLRNLLHKLRSRLPGARDHLMVDTLSVWWKRGGACWVDVDAFREVLSSPLNPTAVAVVLDLYGDHLLPGIYHDWIAGPRAALRLEMEGFIGRAIPRMEDAGRLDLALACAQRSRVLDPLAEAPIRALMQVHTALGERANAVDTYERYAQLLRQELETEPSAETQAVFESVRCPPPPKGNALSGPPPSLVGRQQEWKALKKAWGDAASGASVALSLVGMPGMGKTALCEAFISKAAALGIAVGVARCYDVEGDLPFGAVIELFEGLPTDRLAPRERRELAGILPFDEPVATTHYGERRHLFGALTRALVHFSPCLLVVDDAQWCDRDSLEWLHFALRARNAGGLLVVLTSRPDVQADGSTLTRLLNALDRLKRLEWHTLSGLEPKAAAILARRATESQITPEALELLCNETEGNPLFIVEMARAGLLQRSSDDLELRLPNTIQAVLRERLAPLPRESLIVLEAASVCRRAFRLDSLEQVCSLEPGAFRFGVDALETHGVFSEQGGGLWDISHAMVRDLVYGDMSRRRKAAAHRRFAQVLRGAGGSEPGTVGSAHDGHSMALMAYHLGRGGQNSAAAEAYFSAAENDQKQRAHAQAAARFTSAIALGGDLSPHFQWRARLGRLDAWRALAAHREQEAELEALSEAVWVRTRPERLAEVHIRFSRLAYILGQAHRSLDHALHAYDLASAAGEDGLAARALRCSALARLQATGDDRGSLDDLTRAVALARSVGDSDIERSLLGLLANSQAEVGAFAQAREANDRALALVDPSTNPWEWGVALATAGTMHLKLRAHSDAVAAGRGALPVLEATGDRTWESRVQGLLGLAHQGLRAFDASNRHLRRAVVESEALEERYAQALWQSHLASGLHVQGYSSEAFTLLESAMRLAGEVENTFLSGYLAIRRAWMVAEHGDYERAHGLIASAQELVAPLGNDLLFADLTLARGKAAFAQGSWEQAAAHFSTALSGYEGVHHTVGTLAATTALADVNLQGLVPKVALELARIATTSLKENADGCLEPQRACLVEALALVSLGDDAAARKALGSAQRFVEAAASSIADPKARRRYQTEVPVNRRLALLARQLDDC